MASTCVENLEFDTEQNHRSAHVLPKQPPAVEGTPQTAQNEGQDGDPISENYGHAGFGAIMLRKMTDDGRRPNPTGKSRLSRGVIDGRREPDESRDSRPVLRGRKGEIPSRYLPSSLWGMSVHLMKGES